MGPACTQEQHGERARVRESCVYSRATRRECASAGVLRVLKSHTERVRECVGPACTQEPRGERARVRGSCVYLRATRRVCVGAVYI